MPTFFVFPISYHKYPWLTLIILQLMHKIHPFSTFKNNQFYWSRIVNCKQPINSQECPQLHNIKDVPWDKPTRTKMNGAPPGLKQVSPLLKCIHIITGHWSLSYRLQGRTRTQSHFLALMQNKHLEGSLKSLKYMLMILHGPYCMLIELHIPLQKTITTQNTKCSRDSWVVVVVWCISTLKFHPTLGCFLCKAIKTLMVYNTYLWLAMYYDNQLMLICNIIPIIVVFIMMLRRGGKTSFTTTKVVVSVYLD